MARERIEQWEATELTADQRTLLNSVQFVFTDLESEGALGLRAITRNVFRSLQT